MKKSWLALLGFGGAVAATAWFGSRYSPGNSETREWYEGLDKPPYNPPDYVFPIVWSTLYTLIAISGWRVWRSDASSNRSRALALWAGQLIANADWTRLFFGEHRPKRALVDVLVLETAIILYILQSDDVDRAAAFCFIPYAAWTAFATVLNAEIVRRNPQASRQSPMPEAA
jgi:translocator protein